MFCDKLTGNVFAAFCETQIYFCLPDSATPWIIDGILEK